MILVAARLTSDMPGVVGVASHLAEHTAPGW